MKISNVILDRNPGSDPMGGLRGCGSKGRIELSQNMVMFHIKLNEIKNAANTLPADNPSNPGGGVKRSKFNGAVFASKGYKGYPFKNIFKNMAMMHIKLNEIKKKRNNMEAKFLPAHPPFLLHPRSLGQKIKIQLFQNMVMLHNRKNGIKNVAIL